MKLLPCIPPTDTFTPLKYSEPSQDLTIQENFLINFTHPELMLFCDSCKSLLGRDCVSVLMVGKMVGQEKEKGEKVRRDCHDLCVKCFCHALRRQDGQFSNIECYYVRHPSRHSLTQQKWKICDDLLLLKAIEKYGYGNWSNITIFMQTNECFIRQKEYERHFMRFFGDFKKNVKQNQKEENKARFLQSIEQKLRLNHPHYLLLSQSSLQEKSKMNEGKKKHKNSSNLKIKHGNRLNQTSHQTQNCNTPTQSSLTDIESEDWEDQQLTKQKNFRNSDSSNDIQSSFLSSFHDQVDEDSQKETFQQDSPEPHSKIASIYTPQRNEFLMDHDPYAESLIANLQFTSDDTVEETLLKEQLLRKYNERLQERLKRKRFAIDHHTARPATDTRDTKEPFFNQTSSSPQSANVPAQQTLPIQYKNPQTSKLTNLITCSRKYFTDDEQSSLTQRLLNEYLAMKSISYTLKTVYCEIKQSSQGSSLCRNKRKQSLLGLGQVKAHLIDLGGNDIEVEGNCGEKALYDCIEEMEEVGAKLEMIKEEHGEVNDRQQRTIRSNRKGDALRKANPARNKVNINSKSSTKILSQQKKSTQNPPKLNLPQSIQRNMSLIMKQIQNHNIQGHSIYNQSTNIITMRIK